MLFATFNLEDRITLRALSHLTHLTHPIRIPDRNDLLGQIHYVAQHTIIRLSLFIIAVSGVG